jgi:nucleoside-diphosphate-sugar epimerase
MKLFVTGAGGFVGAAVVRQALDSGHSVVGTLRPGSRAERLTGAAGDLSIAGVDLRDRKAVAATLEQHRPDAIVHVAWSGVSNSARFDAAQITDNVDAACGLIEAGAGIGIDKFVGLGSQGEYGPLNRKTREDDLPEPKTLYGAAKVAVLYLARQLAAQAEMPFAWLRLFSTYGPGDKPNWLIPSLIQQMLDGTRPKTTLGTQKWDYLYIDDVARGVLAAVTSQDATGVFNLGSGQPVAVRTIVETIRDLAAPGMELVFGEIPYGPSQVWHMEADIERLKAASGWSPQVGLHAGLAETVAWHREQAAKVDRAL